MVKDIIDPMQEISKMQKLRKILIRYGHFINFQLCNWYRVIIIVSGSDESYRTEKVRSRFILTVPRKFHADSFLDHCRKTLPMADLLFQDADTEEIASELTGDMYRQEEDGKGKEEGG